MHLRNPGLLLLLLSTLGALCALGAVTAQARTARPSGTLPEARRTEPVLLSGDQLSAFLGAPTSALQVCRWSGSDWELVPAQADERNAAGRFVATEDGKLDGNDALVFMAASLGVAAPLDSWPPDLGREHAQLEVAVADPLNPEYRGFAYVFWSDQRGPGDPAPLVQFDTATFEIRTPTYRMALAGGGDGFIGIKALSVSGSPDLVDRLKMRVSVSLFGLPVNYTEETIGAILTPPRREPLLSGPVRLVFDASGTDVAYVERVSLFGSLGRGLGAGLVEVTSARLSLDLDPAALPATYFDPNVPYGVPIDGRPDAVPASPIPSWHEIRFTGPAGRFFTVGAPAPPDSSLRLYYKDDATVDSRDTGDKLSYGDVGVSATSGNAAGGPAPVMIFLPPGDETTGEALAAAFQQPLVATVRFDGAAPTETPSPTGSAATITPARGTATGAPLGTETPVATAVVPTPRPLYLPLARRP